MMYHVLGRVIARWSPAFILLWLLAWAATAYFAPPWRDVALDQEFAFLPATAPSRLAEEQFAKAFPDDKLGSTIVLLMERADGPPGFQETDKRFVQDLLAPGLRQIADADGGLASEIAVTEESPFETKPVKPAGPRSIMARIRTPTSPGVGTLLVSEDGLAYLVVVELTTDFLAGRNWPVLRQVEDLVHDLEAKNQVPPGTRIFVTGSAVLGRDRNRAQLESAQATERWSIILVVALLLYIYRAPLLTMIPLLTVFMGVRMSLDILTMLTGTGLVTVFEGIQIFVTIVAYGAGVDYCMFLIARYREELDQGLGHDAAMARAIGQTGGALAASAGTTMGGIGMMTFADFGKFHQAGIAIPLSIFMVFLATLTFSACVMLLCGRWAFWPMRPGASADPHAGRERRWHWLANVLQRRPGRIWLATVAVMVPFAVGGFLLRDFQNFDMVRSLPDASPSVSGIRAMRQHFAAGLMGPVSVLVVDADADFANLQDQDHITALTDRLSGQSDALGLADIRTLTAPLGITETARRGAEREGLTRDRMPQALQQELLQRYTSDFGERQKTGTRIELILRDNPFARESLDRLGDLETALRDALPPAWKDAQVHLAGTTASLADLRTVNQNDKARIEMLVLLVVFLILWILIRALSISFYLILSVLFSYYVSLGVTYAVFWMLAGPEFAGLDWKVGIFLFTILIAVGEDYNILLITRVEEEQARHGPLRGVAEALIRTGPIISSCGLIVAGTFASLMMGSLEEMKQLGFALSFGVLLDTFVVRPILVPTFLMWLHGWQTPPPPEARATVEPTEPEA